MTILLSTMRRSVLFFVVLGLFLTGIRVRAENDSTTPAPILYRGDAQRTGAANVNGVPKLNGLAWQKNIGEAGFSSPVYADGVIYLGTNRGELLALDAATGNQQWAFKSVGGNASPAAIEGDVVYVGLGVDASRGMGLYALDRKTGKELWNFQTNSPIWLTSPLIYDGLVYFGDQAGVFYAVDTTTHKEVWRVETKQSVYWQAAVANDIVYFTAMATMYAVDAKTGAERWKKSIRTDWTPLAIDNGLVFAGDTNDWFYALDAKTGEEVWTFKDFPSNRANWSAPAIADDVVYAGNRTGYMYAFKAKTGDQFWKFKTEAPPTSDPVIANGVLYFGVGSHGNTHADQDERQFYALDIKTGQPLWTFKAKGEVFNGPAVSEKGVYFLSAANILYALH